MSNITFANRDCSICGAEAIEEYGGLCGDCWIHLDAAHRAILRGEESPVWEIVEHRTERTIIQPELSCVERLAIWTWLVTLNIAVFYLLWRTSK